MEVKKSPKADLEGKKSTWLLIGYVFILALMFVAFEWTDRDKQVTTETGITDVVFEEEIIPITEQEQKQAPPPVPAPVLHNDRRCAAPPHAAGLPDPHLESE